MKSLLISAVIKIAIKTGIRYFLAKSKRSEKKASKWKRGCLLIVIILLIPSFINIVFNSEPRIASYYVTTPNNEGANVRDCPWTTTCDIIGGLKPGAEIQALGQVEGEAVNENNEWIEFRHNGELAYVHGSLVSTKRPNQ